MRAEQPRRFLVAFAVAVSLASTTSVAAAGAPAPLRPMLLDRQDLGGLADGLSVDPFSGDTTAVDAAADASADCQTPATIHRAGWVAGARLAYGDLDLSPLLRRSGIIGVLSAVDRYRDPASAGRVIARELAADRRTLALRVPGGDLRSWRQTPIPSVAADAHLIEAQLGDGRTVLWLSALVFRRGDLVGVVSVFRADAASARGDLEAAARRLSARIDGVRAGVIKTESPEIPDAAGSAPARAPSGPRLDRMTLRPRDVAPIAYRSVGEYAHGSGGLSYHAEIEGACVAVEPQAAGVDLALSRDEAAARLGFRASLRSVRASLAPAALVRSGSGGIRSARLREVPVTARGAAVAALRVRTVGILGTSEAVVVVLRVGRVTGVLGVGAHPGRSIPRATVARLTRRLVQRVAGELSRTPASASRLKPG